MQISIRYNLGTTGNDTCAIHTVDSTGQAASTVEVTNEHKSIFRTIIEDLLKAQSELTQKKKK